MLTFRLVGDTRRSSYFDCYTISSIATCNQDDWVREVDFGAFMDSLVGKSLASPPGRRLYGIHISDVTKHEVGRITRTKRSQTTTPSVFYLIVARSHPSLFLLRWDMSKIERHAPIQLST